MEDTKMIFAKNDSPNEASEASGFGNIGYSMSRYRRRNRFRLWARKAASAAKPAPLSLTRLVWLICLLYFGAFLIRTGLVFCSSALARHGGQVSAYSITDTTPPLVKNSGEKGNIRLR
jgi:hypothetical protein